MCATAAPHIFNSSLNRWRLSSGTETGSLTRRLYVEKVEMGEAEPRTIISGLVEFQTLEQMEASTPI